MISCSHNLAVQSYFYDTTTSPTLGKDYEHNSPFHSDSSLTPSPHNIASQTTSRFNDSIVHTHQSSRQSDSLSIPQLGCYIPALNSSSQLPYPPGFVTTWISNVGEKQVFFQPADIHTQSDSPFVSLNFHPSNVNRLPIFPPGPSILDQHCTSKFLQEVNRDQQFPLTPAPHWQVRSAETSPSDFDNYHFSISPPPSSVLVSHPRMDPNSGSGMLYAACPCLWVQNGVLCNVMVRATRSQMNRHLRASHGFSGPETRLTRCQWVGCGELMQQGSIARHTVTCHLQAKVTCPMCFKKLSRADVMPKHQRVCPAANR